MNQKFFWTLFKKSAAKEDIFTERGRARRTASRRWSHPFFTCCKGWGFAEHR
jgi:hypothetical protein